MEEHIYCRTLKTDHGTVLDFHAISGGRTLEQHVKIAGRHQSQSWLDLIAVFGLADANGAEFVQTIGEGAGENGGNMLRDDDAGAILGEIHEHFLNRFGSAGGSADGDHR